MTAAIVIAACCLLPCDTVMEDHVAYIDRNTVHDGEGRVVLEQWIYWRRHNNEIHATGWRLVNPETNREPISDGNGKHVQTFWGGNQLRRVRGVYIKTHTQYDPEISDRAAWPKEQRKNLTTQSVFRLPTPMYTPSDADLELAP